MIRYIIPIISEVYGSELYEYILIYILPLAFLSVVPHIIRKIILMR